MSDLDIKDFDKSTPDNNNTVWSVNIAEGANTADMNNSQRRILTVVARGDFGAGPVNVDVVGESTADAGVTVDGVLLKDSAVNVDTIAEQTADAGVTVDGLLIKDGALPGLTLDALPRSYLAGLGISNNAVDAEHDIDIAAGEARSDTNDENIVLASALTKRIDAAWAVGTGNGGLDTGTVAASTWYYLWLIKRTDTDVEDVLFSVSATSPTLPASYTQKRRIGAVLTDSSANIIAFTQVGDRFWWKIPLEDYDATNPGTTAVTVTLSVPPSTVADITVLERGGSSNYFWLITETATSDTAPSASAYTSQTLGDAAKTPLGMLVLADSSSQIRYRQSVSGVNDEVEILTRGWIDRRGQDS